MMTGHSASEVMSDADAEKSGRAVKAMLQMNKIDVAELSRAYAE
jgi:predicted 3-demethylubiquinone-9 3-methyltransferase (glyoxalase superfamily)